MIADLLYQQMVEDELLSASLAKYGGEAAIFFQKAPTDEDPNWEGSSFPRLHYNLDFSFDPERKQAGTLTVDVWVCSRNTPIEGKSPEKALGEQVESLISGMFYSPEEGTILCALWRDTVAFFGKATDTNQETSPVETFGLSITFDMIDFPQQETFSPDPVLALQAWAKKKYPQLKVIGADPLPSLWRPTEETPALYWRMSGADMTREIFACTWYMGQFYGHLSCVSQQERNRWARAISEEIRGSMDLILDDGSFLRLEKSQYRHDGNPLSEGQISLWGEFGVLSSRYHKTEQCHRLNHGYYKREEGKA